MMEPDEGTPAPLRQRHHAMIITEELRYWSSRLLVIAAYLETVNPGVPEVNPFRDGLSPDDRS